MPRTTTTAKRSSDFHEIFPGAYLCPQTTVAAQKNTRSRFRSEYEMQIGSAQVRSTPGTAANASERESQDVEYSETDRVIDLGNTDFVIFDEDGEQLSRPGKKRRFDEFLGAEIKSLSKTIELGYSNAKNPSMMQATRFMITRLRKQKLRLEKTKAWVWNHVEEGSGQSSSTFGVSDEKVPHQDGESYDKFQKPRAAGRLSDYVMTNQLNGALEHIGKAIEKAVDVPDDAFSAIHGQLVESQKIISYVIRCLEYDEDSETESPL